MSDNNENKPSESSATPAGASPGTINLVVKTSKERETIQIAAAATVGDLRSVVGVRYNVEPSRVVLIYSGKILKDSDLLEAHKLKDGQIVHMVIRDANKAAGASATTTSTTSTTASATATSGTAPTGAGPTPAPGPNPANLFSGLFGSGAPDLSNLGGLFESFASGNTDGRLPEMNPALLSQMMNNPVLTQMTDSILANPDLTSNLFRQMTNNPQMQQLIERNPELNHIISNPEIMRQTLRMMSNPSAMEELTRTQDRAMSNLESLPGGYNALQRMYHELQEPMLNAAQEQFGNRFQPSANANAANATVTTPNTTENREPLPNPWARVTGPSAAAAPGTGASANPAASGGGGTGAAGMGGLMSGVESLFSDPALAQSLMSGPHLQNALNFLNNPNSANDIMTQLNSPLFQRMMSNPAAMRAMSTIARGYMELEQALGVSQAELMEMLGASNPMMNMFGRATTGSTGAGATAAPTTTPSTGATATPAPASAPTTATTAASATPGTNTTPAAAAGGAPGAGGAGAGMLGGMNPALLAQMLQMMGRSGGIGGGGGGVGEGAAGGGPQVAPEVRYAAQLEQLRNMGFTNQEANIRALQESFGNVEAAIERLLR